MGESKRRRDAELKARLIAAATGHIAKEWSDRGLLIEGGWQTARVALGWEDLPAAEQDRLRMAFFAGGQHLFASVMQIMDDDREPTLDDLRRMSLISTELDGFAREMTALLVDEPGGHA